MTSNFLTPQNLALRWSLAPHTLSQWRWNGNGPQYLKIGKRILYLLDDVEAFEQKMLRRHTSE